MQTLLEGTIPRDALAIVWFLLVGYLTTRYKNIRLYVTMARYVSALSNISEMAHALSHRLPALSLASSACLARHSFPADQSTAGRSGVSGKSILPLVFAYPIAGCFFMTNTAGVCGLCT